MKIGISSWAFPWAVGLAGHRQPATPLTPAGLLSRAAAWGAEVVQLADNLHLDRLSCDELAALREQASEAGLILEAGTRGVDPAHLCKYLDITRALGAHLLRTLADGPAPRPYLTEVQAQLREALPHFARAGVAIALENYEAYTTRELAALMARVDSRYLGVCLDTVNSFGALESPEQAIATLAPYAINVHFKDFAIMRTATMLGFTVAGRPAGEGQLDVPMLLEQLARYRRDPNLILEQWPPLLGSIEETVRNEGEWAARGLRYLQSLG